MKETELKLHPCYCGGEMKIEKVPQNGGMYGTYYNWVLTCSKCGLIKTYAANGFYGRRYKTFEEVVDDWNRKREESKTRNDLLVIKVKPGINVKADLMDHWRKEILRMKKTGLVLLPWFLEAEVVPEDVEVQFIDPKSSCVLEEENGQIDKYTLWNKAGTSNHITRTDVNVRPPKDNSGTQALR